MASHTPVLLEEVLEHLQLQNGNIVLDATFGRGGYADAILRQIGDTGKLVALDLDEEAIRHGKDQFQGKPILFSQTNFAHMREALESHGLTQVDAIVMDLGVSSPQIDQPDRGFSFYKEGQLDMRFGTHDEFDSTYGSTTAATIIHSWSESELARIFRDFGEERHARKIARAIVKRRKETPFSTTTDLANFVRNRLSTKDRHIHPATRVFQALRIAVNDELESLQKALRASLDVLRPGGRIAVVSFHSLEDRVVKRFGKRESTQCLCPKEFPECRCQHVAKLKILTKRVVTPTLEEVERNPRARSAKLRVFEREKVKGEV